MLSLPRAFAGLSALTFWLFSTQAMAADYRLGTGDKLSVRVHEWPDISGDYAVSPYGDINLPLIGSVPAQGRGVPQIAEQIATLVKNRGGLQDKPSVIIEIMQYRPFYIMGDVEKPGEYAYRPELSALQAISVAGGYYRLTDPGLLRLGRDTIDLQGEFADLQRKSRQIKVKIARLEAEFAQKSDFSLPDDLISQKDASDVQKFKQYELLVLNTRRVLMEQQLKRLEEMKGLHNDEIASLQIQISASVKMGEAVDRELDEVKALMGKGLAPTPRLTLLERTSAQILSDRQILETNIVKAKQGIKGVEQKVDELQGLAQREVLTELQAARTELAANEQRINTVQQLIIEAKISTPEMFRQYASSSEGTIEIVITRKEGDKVSRFVGDISTILAPGDVVDIHRKRED